MKNLIIIFSCFIALTVFAQPKISAESAKVFQEMSKGFENQSLSESTITSNNFSLQTIEGKKYVSALIKSNNKFNATKNLPEGFILSTSVGDIHSLKIEVGSLNQIQNLKNV